MSTLRIVTFDGGGIKGSLSTSIFNRICTAYPEILIKTDLYAGTSIGSVIASLLAYGHSPKVIDELFNYENMKYIFTPRRNNLFKPKYTNKHLKSIFCNYIPKETTLKDLKKHIIIPAFNVKGYRTSSWEIVFFNNLVKSTIATTPVLDAILASCAAPTYFPSHKGFIDGGVIANSPTTPSILIAKSLLKLNDINNIKLLSIGTGDTADTITANTTNWGIAQWAIDNPFNIKTRLLDIILDRKNDLENIYCMELLKQNYHRVNPVIRSQIQLDDYKRVSDLKIVANNFDLSKAYNFIEKVYLK